MAKVKKDKPATTADVRAAKGELKMELAELEKRSNQRQEDSEKRLDKKFDRAVARITHIVLKQMEILLENRGAQWLGVTGEEVKLMKNKQDDHEERITTVEQKIGLRA